MAGVVVWGSGGGVERGGVGVWGCGVGRGSVFIHTRQ